MKPFKLWPFNLHPFVLIPFVLVAFTAITVAIWQIRMRQIEPRNIEQRQIDQRQLAAVRELEGTWEGTAAFRSFSAGGASCTWDERINLTITNQSENGIAGNMTFTQLKGKATGPVRCISGMNITRPITADLVGTRINNLTSGNFIFAGSYTQDTITLNQTNDTGDNMVGTLNLLRK